MAERTALDTNAIRALSARNAGLLHQLGETQVALPVVVLAEAAYGWALQARKAEQRGREDLVAGAMERFSGLLALVATFAILPYDAAAQQQFRLLRAGRGDRSRADLRIAAICLTQDVPLMTRNTADFQDIAGLTLLDW